MIDALRAAGRFVRRRPSVAAGASLVLTLGFAVPTFVFGVHYETFVRGLPVEAPERLVDISMTAPERGSTDEGVSLDDFMDMRAAQRTMDDIALWGRTSVNVASRGSPPERLAGQWATASFFRLLEMSPLLGRLPTAEDERESAPLVAILSEPLWQRKFGGEPGAIGMPVEVNGEAATIIGVLPPGVGFPNATGEVIYLPPRPGAATPERRVERDYWAFGRLKESVSIEAADAELRIIAHRLSEAHPDTNEGFGARAVPIMEGQVGSSASFTLYYGTAAILLLIAIGNVANLFLVHALARARDARVRRALGAGPVRLILRSMGEVTVPVVAGATVGAFLAARALELYGAGSSWTTTRFDAPYIAFVAGLALFVLAAVGVIVGLHAVRSGGDLGGLRDGGRTETGRRFSRVGHGLVVAEIALGGAALFVAGLMVKTALNLGFVDYGFAIDDVLTASVQVDEARYPTAEARAAFWDRLRSEAGAIPGVREATLATALPMIRYRAWTRFELEGAPTVQAADLPGAYRSAVTPEFFDAFGKELIRGRPFTEADGAGSEPVVIVNDDFVKAFFGGENPLGRRIRLGGAGSGEPWMRVVGVAPHLWMDTDVDEHPEGMYVPFAQHVPTSASIALRVLGPPASYAPSLRDVLFRVDPRIPLDDVMTMSELIHMRTSLYRRVGPRFVVLGLIALTMALVGLYGVMSYVARTRTREIGIRIALGARPAGILRLVLGQGLRQIGLGIAFGVVLALILSRGLSRLVFQMTPWDPWVLGLSFATLALAGLAATLLPARRATRVDPCSALRAE